MEAAAGSVQRQGRGSAPFAAACGVLSQYVKAAVAVLPLMPGADVPGAREEAEPGPAPAPQQLTISYGGRVVVLEDVPADRAAELLRVAAAACQPESIRPRADGSQEHTEHLVELNARVFWCCEQLAAFSGFSFSYL